MADKHVRDDETQTPPEGAGKATETEETGTATARDNVESPALAASDIAPDDVRVPEFTAMKEGLGRGSSGGLDRFYDVHVPIWAELGRVELPLGELVRLSEGAVVRLERPISEPVDVVSQGVKLARGEVIVIDDCFAIRIKEIVASK